MKKKVVIVTSILLLFLLIRFSTVNENPFESVEVGDQIETVEKKIGYSWSKFYSGSKILNFYYWKKREGIRLISSYPYYCWDYDENYQLMVQTDENDVVILKEIRIQETTKN